MSVIDLLNHRWKRSQGYRQVLAISLPLIASMGTITLMQFTDRIFLANYRVEAISAALPAGILSFTLISFFMGVASYTNAFVAQYTGAKRLERVGAAIWQGGYFALISACILASFYFLSRPLFALIGHSPPVRELEIAYFNILTLGAGLVVLSSALSCFYTGRGLTWAVMWVHLAGAALNIPLDYCLIYGVGPFPVLGIVGAAIATVSASALINIIFILLIFNRHNRSQFGTWRNRRWDGDLFARLMRYGLPSGGQFFLEIFGFAFFIQMLGRLGDLELAASNIVLSIESLAFLPMFGVHIATTTLVGQAIGSGQPDDAVIATTSSLHIAITYMVLMVAIFTLVPEPLLALFENNHVDPALSGRISKLGIVLLRFVALFCLFDAMNLVFSGALKGAGDTQFILGTIAALSCGVMILPIYLAIEIFEAGIYTAWVLITLYIAALGVAFYLRYRHGKWKKMRVIEAVAAA
ncbi:MAG: MATE family efflux transporter [Deltaproteobacteria bacterium]|nr:MATE family efflux transporter [Deltaproteobacteria bacterium]